MENCKGLQHVLTCFNQFDSDFWLPPSALADFLWDVYESSFLFCFLLVFSCHSANATRLEDSYFSVLEVWFQCNFSLLVQEPGLDISGQSNFDSQVLYEYLNESRQKNPKTVSCPSFTYLMKKYWHALTPLCLIMSDLLTFKSLSAAGHTEVNTTWSALHILLCFLQLCWQCWHDLQLCHWSCGPQRSTWLGWSQLSSARLPKQIVIVQVLRVGRIAHTFGQGLPRARLRPVGYSKPRFKSSLEVIYGETLQLTLLIELGHVQSV